ncbi:Polyketide_cyc domain-containing protein [Candidatus Hydrogenisulfobacillus filiaventi]|uniref:Polyketide_cyc domain-containing protein n=1 Tax=Candidatus Hydrogenisulfobacillus filiaventi TaxID=2707344 RepID=A0A6F8ZG25_9FIRM|nr:aromatase/cyclase [Bacillota bacterium]CAB1128730.1 Polyketide_cyc domain-containing protein [Candidatus Hydrogenisulfobacillus filiaventi]
MPTVEVAERIPAAPEAVFAVLSDMSRFPEFMDNVEEITILERGPDTTVSRWVTRLQGARFRWTERDRFYPGEWRITYEQIEGDLKRFQGYWQLEPDGDGCRVRLVTEFEFGMPMLASLLNPVAALAIRENARGMIRALGQALAP